MNPGKKGFDLCRSIQDLLGMIESGLLQGITIKNLAVGFNRSMVFIKESVGQILGIFVEKLFGYLHSGEGWSAFGIGADSHECSLFGFGFSLPEGSGSKEGFIKLYETAKLIALVSLRHGRSDFVRHEPNCLVRADSQESLSLHHRDTMFIAAHEKNEPKPDFQRHMGLMKDGPCSQRDLDTAIFALIKSARLVQACSFGVATRTFETLRPTLLFQMLAAGQFSWESTLYG